MKRLILLIVLALLTACGTDNLTIPDLKLLSPFAAQLLADFLNAKAHYTYKDSTKPRTPLNHRALTILPAIYRTLGQNSPSTFAVVDLPLGPTRNLCRCARQGGGGRMVHHRTTHRTQHVARHTDYRRRCGYFQMF